MNRTAMLKQMEATRYDLLVIGGGITGAGVAREASLRGLKVALVEQLDFASGTSSRSTKLVHGGLRYLKQYDFKLVREAVAERQRLVAMAPHLVKVARFAFPVYRGDPDRLFALRIGLFIYDLFAGMQAAVPHRMLGPEALLQEEPQLRHDGLLGGAVYTDCRTNDGRLTLTVLQSAVQHGAAVANYVKVQEFLRDSSGKLTGAFVRDALSGDVFDLQASRILAAAGPWADEIRRLDDPAAPPILRLTKGVHLAFPHARLPVRDAVVIHGRDQRLMFAVPTGEYTYVGTTDTDHPAHPAAVHVDKADVDYILDAANHAFPAIRLTYNEVVSEWAGLRPLLKPPGNASPSATTRDYSLFHSPSGLVTVGGGKLTAFRGMAGHIVDTLFPATRGPANLAASTGPLPGADGPLPGPDDWDRLAAETGAGADQVRSLCEAYGTALPALAEQLPTKPGPDPALTWYRAMVRYAVKHELAQRLEDVYRRRTGLMLFTDDNGRRYLEPLAKEMATVAGWSVDRYLEELSRCRAMLDESSHWRQEQLLERATH